MKQNKKQIKDLKVGDKVYTISGTEILTNVVRIIILEDITLNKYKVSIEKTNYAWASIAFYNDYKFGDFYLNKEDIYETVIKNIKKDIKSKETEIDILAKKIVNHESKIRELESFSINLPY